MAKLHITDREGVETVIEGEVGISVMENLRDNDYELEAICGGQCSCATCHIYIDDAWMAKIGARNDEENELLEELDCVQPNSRLSCQIEFTEDMDGLAIVIAPDE
ncbi:2Fe-2S iron-sulfur cluster-binding protein [Iodidimonas sp. SYSU 1G8]|uniref:2Fe-2S iron-sulfur cluster-binding protein n=1 Tax=Iodidimonas sp. SYSU 1G8 TaxID=3133967 RepID=UPI0031FE5D15